MNGDPMTSPLLDNLTKQQGYPLLDEESLPGFLEEGANSVLFFTGDPAKHPETLDVAVILPELMKVLGDRCRAGIVARAAEEGLQKRFGFNAWPALVFLRGDQYLGSIERVKDWAVYLSEIDRLLSAEPSRPPGIGIPVVGERVGSCG